MGIGNYPGWFAEAMYEILGGSDGFPAQIANVAAAAAQTSSTLTENGTTIPGTQTGSITSLVDPATDAGASVIDGIRECAVMINALVADVTELRTQLNAEIAAIKTSNLQASA